MTENNKGFDLSELLQNVSELDTGNIPGREQIEYIDLELIDADPANFYELSEIDSLASNIALIGLQQPLRVKPNPEAQGRWRIVSGHRRRAALQKLVEEGRQDFQKVACIKESGEGSAALQELRLIYANSDTRKMSAADVSRQVERIQDLLCQLKEEGYEFPGRMRDHVAEVCKVSKTKIARLKVIRDNLIPEWAKLFRGNGLRESPAYALAQLPKEHQEAIFEKFGGTYVTEDLIKRRGERLADVDKVVCKLNDAPCINCERKYKAAMNFDYYRGVPCKKCCSKCEKLVSCKYACPKLAEKVKQLKADAKAQRAQEKLAQEEQERPTIQKIQKYWNRFGQARNAADVSVKRYYNAADMYYCSIDNEKVVNLECLEAKFSTYTNLPYGHNCSLTDVERYVKIADLFGCSLDYLLCRTDDPKGVAAAAEAAAASGRPTDIQILPGNWYPATVEPPIGEKIIVVDDSGFADDGVYLGGGVFEGVAVWKEVLLWSLMPDLSRKPAAGNDAAAANGRPTPSQSPAATALPGGEPMRWKAGSEKPEKEGFYAVKFFAENMKKALKRLAWFDGTAWRFSDGGPEIEVECIGWYPLPEDE